MTKTLADMTAEERADCVGMWAEHAHPHYDGLEVIIDSDHDSVTTISTKSGQQYIVVGEVMRHITPRFDLPRAWTPDGEPEIEQALAEETWEYSFQIKYADGWETASNSVTEIDEWWPDKSDAEQAANSAYDPYIERPMRLVRRRVSPPEVINE